MRSKKASSRSVVSRGLVRHWRSAPDGTTDRNLGSASHGIRVSLGAATAAADAEEGQGTDNKQSADTDTSSNAGLSASGEAAVVRAATAAGAAFLNRARRRLRAGGHGS